MGVDVDQRHRPVPLLDRAQDRPGQRVIAPKGQRDDPVAQHLAVMRGDDVHRLLQIEYVDRNVAQVRDLQMLERRRACRHVVGPDHPRLIPDLPGPQPRAGAIAGPMIHRNPDERRVQPRRTRRHRQPHHRCRAAEPRHLVAAEGLVETGHLDCLPCWSLPTLRRTPRTSRAACHSTEARLATVRSDEVIDEPFPTARPASG